MFEGLITLGVATGFAHALQSARAFREARAAGQASWWTRIGRWAGLAGLPLLIVWLVARLPLGAACLYLVGAGLWITLLRLLLPSPESSIYRERFERPRSSSSDSPAHPARTSAPEEPQTLSPRRATAKPSPGVAAPEEPPSSNAGHEGVGRAVQLHCRSCGSPVSKPLHEAPEATTHPRSAGYYAWFSRTDPATGVLTLKRQDLSGSVLPLEHHPGRIGCCGFPGGTEPNIRCHGCGHWVLVDIEDCQASAMTAARTKEIEIRLVPSQDPAD